MAGKTSRLTGRGSGGSVGSMTTTAKSEALAQTVAVGQVWSDNDVRLNANAQDRRAVHVDRVEGEYAHCTVGVLRGGVSFVPKNRRTRILIARFRPGRTGYTLVLIPAEFT